jgi:HD-GYP domain-containing protein (c-di-GMP phosphodiesterase class II)
MTKNQPIDAKLPQMEAGSASAISVEALKKLNDIGVALSAEHNIERLLEMILEKAKSIANADAGILFTRHEIEPVLIQRVRHCDSLDIHLGGTTGEPTYGYPVELYDNAGNPRETSVTAYCATRGKTVNIPDVYDYELFDFSSTREFDRRRDYRTKSVLAVPMKNKRGEVLGVIRLSNAHDENGNLQPFDATSQHLIESLASQGAVALDNELLINGLEDLLQALIQLVAKAIDQKSPHTGNHLQKVPIITEMITEAACESKEGSFADFELNEEEMYEVRIAAWLHDCGKLSTPDYILEKGTKLQSFFDRIELIGTRLEVCQRDAEIAWLRGEMDEAAYRAKQAQLQDDWEFLQKLNEGAEWVPDEYMDRLDAIARYLWNPRVIEGTPNQPFFSEDELKNLRVRRGTLTDENRQIIMDHVVHSIDMLNRMPFPRQLKRVPEYAGGHHERMDGKGYPNGLKGEDMSIPARIMAVADVFEALTSHDRPYKKPKKLSEAREIMRKMAAGGGMDPEIVELLWSSNVVRRYAERYLLPDQADIEFVS